MSSPEFFGVFLAFTLAACSVLFIIIGYELAIHREFRQMKRFLRLAGILSLSSWAVMFCENECWLIMGKDRPQAQQMAVRQTAAEQQPDMIFTSSSGATVHWNRPQTETAQVWAYDKGI